MDYRQAWKKQGGLTDCPNPAHQFKIGRLIGQWRWAADCWSTVTADGHMHNYGLCVCTVNTLDGYRVFKIIVGKLSVMLGVKAKGGAHG